MSMSESLEAVNATLYSQRDFTYEIKLKILR